MHPDRRPEILDCTIRDGGYVNAWRFDAKTVRETYRALSAGGVDFVELGFRAPADRFDRKTYGIWRNTTQENLVRATQGIDGPAIALMGNYGEVNPDDFEDAADSVARMVRIAAHKHQLGDALALLERIKAKGYITSLQAMAFGSYDDNDKAKLREALKHLGVDYCYVADSYGSMMPHELRGHLEPLLELGTVRVGFHPHNNLQMAFANTLEAIRLGVHIVDCSIFGMGRGAGNLPTEALLAYLSTRGTDRYNVIPILNCIERYFEPIRRRHPWGYGLPYMVSGVFDCHPYYAAELVKRKEYSIEDIWTALEVVDELKPTGFDATLVDTLIKRGVVGGLGKRAMQPAQRDTRDRARATDPEELHASARNLWRRRLAGGTTGETAGETTDETPAPQARRGGGSPCASYTNRHTGRDFLVLANGPSLKLCRPQIQALIKALDPICLGANNLSRLFVPTYHAFTNKHRFVTYADTVSRDSKLLVGENISNDMIRAYVRRDYETLCFDDILDADFDIADGRILTNCRTVSVLLLGVAVVMGARRLFVAGMDGYLGKGQVTQALFYDEAIEPDDYDVIVERHRWNERFLDQIDHYVRDRGQEGIRILTPTSHKRFYKSIEHYLKPSARNHADVVGAP